MDKYFGMPPPGDRMPPPGDRMPPPGAMPPRGPMAFPPPPPPRDLRTQAVSAAAGGPPPPIPAPRGKGMDPLGWEDYFSKSEDVTLESGDSFRVYSTGPAGAPVIICLHGGGYSGLTWGLVAQRLGDKYRVVAPDLRGHGGSKTSDDSDLSAGRLAADVVALWKATYANEGDKPPPVLLVGHSMGGAIAVRAACLKQMTNIQGVVVIDVVEGTALASLAFMHGILSNRPRSFASPQKAIEWASKSGMSKNMEAARLSVPAMLTQGEGGKWTWRTDLEKSDVFWRGWYEGLSQLFLGAPGYKMLMLAGSDRLDKDLTIGQMQGKFQMQLLPAAGHAIHEDEPDKAAEAIRGFAHRYRIGEGPLVFPKPPPPVPRASGSPK